MAEKRRRQVKEFPKEPCTDCPYQSLEDIETLIFLDRMYSAPATRGTFLFMEHMFKHHPDDLYFLWEKSQEFVGIKGSQYRIDFPRWLGKVKSGLDKYNKKER
ncbi:hypothetical protein [Halomonas sp. 25-S5]|uniref:hypothetical protein n=1 Tax=Halomonas sp. 25-S5 TaxID=2994065 RepID=UPI00246911F5|nr:hypothetical protein [Halomonas sp. 25-S5]